MSEKTRRILEAVKAYIEEMEVKVDGEWGCVRELEELIRDGDMPALYREVTELLQNDVDAVIIEPLHCSLFALLESRHETLLQWCDPWPACGPEGNDLDAHVILRATVHDCINMQRRVAKAAGRPTMGDDGNHLLDFMAIHCTRVVDANDQVQP